MAKVIHEPARDIKICREAEVVVVGGGAAGAAAAIAAARTGARTILVERYGHLGGLASGGQITLIMPMSDGTEKVQIGGICREIIDRLDSIGAALHPKPEEIGSADPHILGFWKDYSFCVVDGHVRFSAFVDPEALKCVLNDMVEEAGVSLLLHSWAARALTNDDEVKAVVFESKSGRQAVAGGIFIDTSGDGDIFASAGAPFESAPDPKFRSSRLAFVFRIGNIDAKKYYKFRKENPDAYVDLIKELESLRGFTQFIRTVRDDAIWVNNAIPDLNGLNIEDLTRLEIEGRKRMRLTYDFLKKRMPGFADSFIMDSASQIGVRCTRRLTGEHVITTRELYSGTIFPDTVVMGPDFRHTFSPEHPHWHVPYRALLARRVKNVLAAGRCISGDVGANDILAPIQYCFATGQAAGTAAALAIRNDTDLRDININRLQALLRKQGVPLPDDILMNK